MAWPAMYLAADTIGITLVASQDNQMWGAERKHLTVGPWTIDLWVEAHSDVVDQKEAGIWVVLTQRVWLYVWVGTRRTWIIVFDAREVGITKDNRTLHGRGTARATAQYLYQKKAVKAVYQWDSEGSKWVRVPNSVLEPGEKC